MPVLVRGGGGRSECASVLLLLTLVFGAQYWKSLVHTRCLRVTFLSNHAMLSMQDPAGPKGTHLHELECSPLLQGVKGGGSQGCGLEPGRPRG